MPNRSLNAYFCQKALKNLQVLFDIIARARHVPKKEWVNVFKDDVDKVNAFGQAYFLRPKGSERADLVGRKVSSWTVGLDEKTCTRFLRAADGVHLLGGQIPKRAVRFDVTVLLGGFGTDLRTRVSSFKRYLRGFQGKTGIIVASASDRKLWAFDARGKAVEPIAFRILAERCFEKFPKVYASPALWRYRLKAQGGMYLKKYCLPKGIVKVKDISEKTSRYFFRKYGVSWPTEKDMMAKIIAEDKKLRNKVFMLTARSKWDGGRATTDQNADSIMTLMQKGSRLLVVSNGAFGDYQGQVHAKKFPEAKVYVLAEKLKTDGLSLNKQRDMIKVIADSLARSLYARINK